jgi:hypothetical protein
MDPVSLIVGALAVGAASGTGNVAAAAVQDAYGALKRLLLSRCRSQGDDLRGMLAGPELESEAGRRQLADLLSKEPAVVDEEVVAAARRILRLADSYKPLSGQPRVDLRGAQGVQFGDRNAQSNVFDNRTPG